MAQHKAVATRPVLSPVILGSVLAAYGLALTVFFLRLVGSQFPIRFELGGAVALAGVIAVSPTLAVLAARRKTLLLAAGLTAMSTLLGFSVLALPMIVIGLIWLVAYGRMAVPGPISRKIATVAVVWLLTTAAFGVLFLHIDPRCADTLSDGRVRMVDVTTQGMESGWIWNVRSSFAGTSSSSPDVVLSVCSSDTVVAWEAALSIGLSLGALSSGWSMTSRLQGVERPGSG